MNRDDAKRLLANVHDEIVSRIDAGSGSIEPTVLIDFLHDIADKLTRAQFGETPSFYTPFLSFEESYRELALTSIDSYSSSNEIFAEISKQQQSILGAMNAADNLKAQFSRIQNNFNGEVARANEVIGELTEHIRELESKVSMDPLTKVYNRRGMEQYLGRIIEKYHHADKTPLHLLIIDIDDFKSVNDNYGHIAGDKVLIFLANLLKETLRENDRIFRYGGEEFIITLNRISAEGARSVAERILSLVRHNKLKYKEHEFSVTLSLGLTTLHPDDTMEVLIERADDALYRAKKNGKDQLYVEQEWN